VAVFPLFPSFSSHGSLELQHGNELAIEAHMAAQPDQIYPRERLNTPCGPQASVLVESILDLETIPGNAQFGDKSQKTLAYNIKVVVVVRSEDWPTK
jgi:hypothetical protein